MPRWLRAYAIFNLVMLGLAALLVPHLMIRKAKVTQHWPLEKALITETDFSYTPPVPKGPSGAYRTVVKGVLLARQRAFATHTIRLGATNSVRQLEADKLAFQRGMEVMVRVAPGEPLRVVMADTDGFMAMRLIQALGALLCLAGGYLFWKTAWRRPPQAVLCLGIAALVMVGCRHPAPAPTPPAVAGDLRSAPSPLARLGFTIQAGAFAKVENAARLAERLREQGLEATHFPGQDGLFRVRFGDFPTKEGARLQAEALKRAGTIEVYYVVAPEPEPPLLGVELGTLRAGLVQTAESYLGVPYLWGGTTADRGFDCSGLAMAVYRMNGMRLPRSSRDQYTLGRAVARETLQPGDLLFFATGAKGKVNHVAVFVGGDAFIHAPGQGRVICRDSLRNPVLARQFMGGRTYLG